MRSSAPNERSSGSGPEGVGDTTLFAATAASFASDGPTLPIVGGLEERAGMTRSSPITGDPRPSKKQKTSDGIAKEVGPATAAPKESQITLAPLYKPWTLLPAELLPQIEKRLGGNLEENIEVVVWTKNQNVKSGINRLKALLRFAAVDGPDGKNKDTTSSKNSGKLIAISASGQGTTKMIGIVEMAKRIVGGKVEAEEAKKASGETWYAYTGLTGLKMPTKQGEGNEEKRVDEAQEQDAGKKVPVLTVWFSRNSIPEFKKAFGEQTFTVVHHASDT